jgi:hypothetical protein
MSWARNRRRPPRGDLHLSVSAHALRRWRERAARYGDESLLHIEAAFYESVEVGPKDPLPTCRKSGARYFLHAATGCYFVADATRPGWLRIITILDPRPARPLLVPKRKSRKDGGHDA